MIAPESAPEDEFLGALQRERDEAQAKYLRALADFDAYQKRARREQERLREAGVREILKELIVVVDGLDLALAAGRPAAETVEGVSSLRGQLLGILERHGDSPPA